MTTTGRMIAVKEIELDEDESDRARDDYESVRQEVNILRALNHRYIVKYETQREKKSKFSLFFFSFLGIALENKRLVKIFMVKTKKENSNEFISISLFRRNIFPMELLKVS